MARPTHVILNAGFFFNAEGKGGGLAKRRPDAATAQPYSDSLVDAEANALLAAHPDPVESAVITAAANDLKARALHYATKGARVDAVLPVMPSEASLFEAEDESA